MPKLSVWFVRAALLYMGIGFSFGALILCAKDDPRFIWAWQLYPLHSEMMIFGWMMSFGMGIAYWILPRFSKSDHPYGKSRLGWLSLSLLNSGLLLRLVGLWTLTDGLSLLGYGGLFGAVLSFAVLIYPRIKPLASYAPD